MATLKDHMGKYFSGKKIRLSGCCISGVVEGYCVSYSISSGELMLHIQTEAGKIYKFGENHPNLEIEIL